MPFQRQAGRPVGVAPVGPWRDGPARVEEVQGFRDVVAVHLAECVHDFVFRGFVVLMINAVGFVGDDGHEK